MKLLTILFLFISNCLYCQDNNQIYIDTLFNSLEINLKIKNVGLKNELLLKIKNKNDKPILIEDTLFELLLENNEGKYQNCISVGKSSYLEVQSIRIKSLKPCKSIKYKFSFDNFAFPYFIRINYVSEKEDHKIDSNGTNTMNTNIYYSNGYKIDIMFDEKTFRIKNILKESIF